MLLRRRWNHVLLAAAWLSLLVVATATVASGCSGSSPTTGPSSNPTACAFVVSPGAQAVAYDGAAGTIAVTTTNGCAWTATTDVNWITLMPPTSGSGSGTVKFAVVYNQESFGAGSTIIPSNPRTGSVLIAGERSMIEQAGSAASSCVLAIDPTNQTIGAAGGAGASIAVSASHCGGWTAASNAPWMAVTAGAAGTGTGAVSFSVEANTGAERIGTLTIAGRTATITQTAVGRSAPPPSAACWSTITPTENGIGGFGTPGNFVFVTTPSTCAWTAVSNDPWLTIVAGASGTGNGIVKYDIASNPGAARRGTLTIAGQVHTVAEGALRFGGG